MRSSQELVSTHKAQLSDQVSLNGFGKLQPDGGKKAEAALVPKAGQATPEGSHGAQRGRGI